VERKRYDRLRLLIRRLNRERKKQAKKTDILCNDLIAAQKDFIKKLETIGFAANFYESIVGITDLSDLLYNVGSLIKGEIPDANIAFFLRRAESFELHMFESDQPITLEKQNIENCFTAELVDNICKSNKSCTLEDMFAMGLQGSPGMLSKISACTIPLSRAGSSLGFIFMYRCLPHELTAAEINNIAAVSRGLSHAIACCQVLLGACD
jgi:hypothetical protein